MAAAIHPGLEKKLRKEGGKKGQDVVGMSEMGSVKFFCVTIESANNMDHLKVVLEGMNVKVEEGSEERRGGAGGVAKTLFSAGKSTVDLIVHVPSELQEQASPDEWAAVINERIGTAVVGKSDDGTCVYCSLECDPDKEQFPLKLRDAGIAAGWDFLTTRNLVVDDESDDDANYAEMAGVEW